jgi:hypothetical protein
MGESAQLLFGDWTTALLDMASDATCNEGTVICGLADAFDSVVVWTAALLLCIAFGFVLALSFAVVSARAERSRGAARSSKRRLLSGPVHTDGAWVRLVEDERGRRVVEVLADETWTPSTRSLSQFTLDVPVDLSSTTKRPRG